jgi:hypothetical protein
VFGLGKTEFLVPLAVLAVIPAEIALLLWLVAKIAARAARNRRPVAAPA